MRLGDVAYGTGLGQTLAGLAGRSVLVRVKDPLFAALALVELDGVASRLVICPPDLEEEHLPYVAEVAALDAVVSEKAPPAALSGLAFAPIVRPKTPLAGETHEEQVTEWVMFTSGTSGRPKMVVHTLAGLSGAIQRPAPDAPAPTWGTFYDVRRYGGLQILLRALLSEGSLVLTGPDEPMGSFLDRLARHQVTHLTGTPSHWRWALMNPAAKALHPRYVRLSGEIADQAILDSLRDFFPGVPMGHAYASTEAGVGFEVTDGLEGFPASLLEADGPVRLKVEDGSLRLKSTRIASRYLGEGAAPLAEPDGFVDSGDMVELRGARYHFVGRRNGVINVGGLKVHPEEVEAVINRHPAVRMSLVRGRRNPITGAIVIAELVLTEQALRQGTDEAKVKEEVLRACREALPPFKTPASVRIVPTLAMTAGGKLERGVA
ncbi:MAG: long-chain fatty acid--CoA ligase [Caulobacteraceae bacterium]|nr:long-chain fatty acid--CoA ligase [Caulobacteraceae bacterium]